VETDWNASVRGKLGWANGPLLFYATGGVAFANVEVWGSSVAHTDFFALNTADTEGIAVPRAERFPGDFNPVPFASAQSTLGSQKRDHTYTGWTAGAGVDLALTDCLTVALEYRHTDFGDNNFHFDDFGGPFFTNSGSSRNHGGSSIGLDSDQVTVRVNLNLVRFFFGH
jgi:outer membrane immunogenic protein